MEYSFHFTGPSSINERYKIVVFDSYFEAIANDSIDETTGVIYCEIFNSSFQTGDNIKFIINEFSIYGYKLNEIINSKRKKYRSIDDE
jgi:hypothetical protein